MPLSNTTQEILSSGPYWDDFNRDKNFHRILHKPRLPVQTRELNQVQSIFQNQVEQLTTGIFREGAAVTGGQQTFSNTVFTLQVVRSDDVNINNFYNSNTATGVLVRGVTSGAEAIVNQVDTQTGSDYAAIIISPLTAEAFEANETLQFIQPVTEVVVGQMVAAPEGLVTKNACTFSVDAGVFYLRGHLVDVKKQTIVINTSSTRASSRIGFEVNETIVTYDDDGTLLDPALETTNYAAPGADRLKVEGVLATRPVRDAQPNADDGFIEIGRVIDGVYQMNPDRLEREFIEQTLARRTYDESGDYVVSPFQLFVRDHNPPVRVPNITGFVTGNTTSSIIQASSTETTILLANGSTSNVTTLFDSEVVVGDTLVVRGESREVTAVTSNTVLTVNEPFTKDFEDEIATVISPNKLNLELGKGKAYVRGYEVETLGITKLEADRARTTQAIDNGYVGTPFGPYVQVNRDRGVFDVSTLELVDVHSVDFSGITNNSAGVYGSSKIGTARVRSFLYESGNDEPNNVYRLYLVNAEFDTKNFEVVAQANSDIKLTTVSTNATAKTITITQNVSTAVTGSIVPLTNGAFNGATIKLIHNFGYSVLYTVLNSVYSNTTTTDYTHTITVDGDDQLSQINTTANVSFIFSDKCIRSVAKNIGLGKGATVASVGKVGGVSTGTTIMRGSTSPGLLFRIREGSIDPATLTDESFQIVRYITSVAGTIDGSNSKYSITAVTNESPYPQGAEPIPYMTAALTSNGAAAPLDNATAAVNTTAIDLFIPYADVPSANSTYTPNIDVLTHMVMSPNPSPTRTKTLVLANTDVANVAISSANLVSNVGSLTSRGHIAINNINSTSASIVGLGIADVYALQKVYAVPDATDTGTWIDVTNNYTFDNGQRDWCYDHASITLKPGKTHYTVNCSQMLVMADVFVHSAVTGNANYFTAQSYVGFDVEDIPVFRNPKTGITHRLWDCIDFRAVRVANAVLANTATNPYTSATTTFNQSQPPHPDGTFVADYEYYLSRIDKIVLTKDKTFRVIQGTPSATPVAPRDEDNGITLYMISYPPYTANVAAVGIFPFEYKRYTMRDIGKLEKRIENLEYYASLSTLDLQTINKPEYDENDIERFKNGIITDSFANQAIANFKNSDTKISIDTQNLEMRPSFEMEQYNFNVRVSTSNNVVGFSAINPTGINTGMVSLPFSTTPFVTQGLASTSVNINPFNVVSWVGSCKLLPSSDTWIDVITKPSVTINLYNENDGLDKEGTEPLSTEWNVWEEHHTGVPVQTRSAIYEGRVMTSDPDNPHPQWNLDGIRDQYLQDVTMTTTTEHTQMRQQVVTYRKVSFQEKELGERIIDTAISPKMRGNSIDILAAGLYPGCVLRAYFDDIDVTALVDRANDLYLEDEDTAADFRVGDTILGSAGGRARIVGITRNILRVVDASGSFLGGTISVESGTNIHHPETDNVRSITGVAVQRYVSWHGKAQSVSASPWRIQLDTSAPTSGDVHGYVGKTIYFSDGGYNKIKDLLTNDETDATSAVAGATAKITAYNPATRTVTLEDISSSFTTAFTSQVAAYTTDNPIRYSIGELRAESTAVAEAVYRASVMSNENYSPDAVQPGVFFGMFRLPGWKVFQNDAKRRYTSAERVFNSGSHTFRLENASDDTESYARASYSATGTTVTKQRQWARTRDIDTWSERVGGVKQTGTYSTSISSTETVFQGWIDPLAQTFLVLADKFPSGVFVTHVDLFFAKKGSSGIPVTVQIRPTVNGYPAADGVLGQSVVQAWDIQVVPEGTTPSTTNANHYTRCYFDQPVYLAPDVEYSLVVMANTQEYELFVGEIGKKVIGTDSIIADQPLGGVFFKSQNARTWTPEQTMDLMFVLHRAEFETRTGYLNFEIANNAWERVTPFEYDLLQINTGHLDFDPTRQYSTFTYSTVNLSDVLDTRPLVTGTNLIMPERMKIAANTAGSLLISATLRTANGHVSPLHDLQRVSAIAVKNRIDNGELYANGFAITQGIPYSPVGNAASNSYLLTITGGNGADAEIYANTNSTGYVTSIYVVNAGSGYTETPTIAFPSANTSDYNGTAPSFTYSGETSPSSGIFGEQKARYITRTITLASGFDASDLKVYLSASRTQRDNVDVYYKVLATGDPQRFEDKSWVLMNLKDGQETLYATGQSAFREYEYVTTDSSASYTHNGTTFDRFHSFAIKVVLRSTSTTIVPRVRRLRAIALDE